MEKIGQDSVSTGILFQYFSQVVFLLSGLLFFTILMHLFPSSFVGDVVLVSTIVQIFTAIFGTPFQNVFMHFTSYNIHNINDITALSRKFLYITIALTVIASAILFTLSPILSSLFFHNPDDTNLLRVSSIYLGLSVAATLVSALEYGLQRFRRVNIVKGSASILSYTFALFLAILTKSLILVVIGLSIGQIVMIVLLLIDIPKERDNVSSGLQKNFMKEIIAYVFPLMLTVLIGNPANHVDKLITSSLMNVSSVGIYNLSLMVATGLFGAFASVNQILLPKLSELYSENRYKELEETTNRAIRIISAIYIPASLGIAAMANQIVVLLGGKGYISAVIPLQIILFISALLSPIMVVSIIPNAIRKTKINYIVSPASLVTNLLISVTLIPVLGIVGAALGFAALYPVRYFIILYYSKNWIQLKIHWWPLIKVWGIAILMAIIVFILGYTSNFSEISMFYLIPLGFFFYTLFLRFSRILSRQDFSLFLDVIPFRFKLLREIISHIIPEES